MLTFARLLSDKGRILVNHLDAMQVLLAAVTPEVFRAETQTRDAAGDGEPQISALESHMKARLMIAPRGNSG